MSQRKPYSPLAKRLAKEQQNAKRLANEQRNSPSRPKTKPQKQQPKPKALDRYIHKQVTVQTRGPQIIRGTLTAINVGWLQFVNGADVCRALPDGTTTERVHMDDLSIDLCTVQSVATSGGDQ